MVFSVLIAALAESSPLRGVPGMKTPEEVCQDIVVNVRLFRAIELITKKGR